MGCLNRLNETLAPGDKPPTHFVEKRLIDHSSGVVLIQLPDEVLWNSRRPSGT